MQTATSGDEGVVGPSYKWLLFSPPCQWGFSLCRVTDTENGVLRGSGNFGLRGQVGVSLLAYS